MNFTISYAITVCDEHKELEKLLEHLTEHKRDQDEIVIQADKDNVTKDVVSVIDNFKLEYIEFPLNKDFASFKNNLKSKCKGDYIFQIDADEIPATETVKNLDKIIAENLDIDLFLVPRVNIVNGIEYSDVEKWKWKMDHNGWINFPDYQYRIFKNNFNIKWQNKVHENIVGANTGTQLPPTQEYALIHIKEIDKQRKQNKLYENIK